MEGGKIVDGIEELLADYIKENNLSTYTDFKICDVLETGHLVIFREVEADAAHPMYFERHNISMLDIIAWTYGKIKGVK